MRSLKSVCLRQCSKNLSEISPISQIKSYEANKNVSCPVFCHMKNGAMLYLKQEQRLGRPHAELHSWSRAAPAGCASLGFIKDFCQCVTFLPKEERGAGKKKKKTQKNPTMLTRPLFSKAQRLIKNSRNRNTLGMFSISVAMVTSFKAPAYLS